MMIGGTMFRVQEQETIMTIDTPTTIDDLMPGERTILTWIARAENGWINAYWVRLYAGYPRCEETVWDLDRLVELGLVEMYTPAIPAGDLRRLDDDVRVTPVGEALMREMEVQA